MLQLKKYENNERKERGLIHVPHKRLRSLTRVLQFYREIYELCDLDYNA